MLEGQKGTAPGAEHQGAATKLNVKNHTSATRLLKAIEAAEQLAIGQRKLWEITNTGELKSIKIGRAVRYHQDDIVEFIAKHRGKRGVR